MENKKSELKNKNGKVIYKIMTKGLLIMAYIVLLNILQASQVFATDDPLAVINNLSTFMFGIMNSVHVSKNTIRTMIRVQNQLEM